MHRQKPQRKLSDYQKKLLDPRWQKARLHILERDQWQCQRCKASDKTLAVHHRVYFEDVEPWDTPEHALETLCEDCHAEETHQGRDAEKDLIMTLRGLGAPWFALDALTRKLRECFPPLGTHEAMVAIGGITRVYLM